MDTTIIGGGDDDDDDDKIRVDKPDQGESSRVNIHNDNDPAAAAAAVVVVNDDEPPIKSNIASEGKLQCLVSESKNEAFVFMEIVYNLYAMDNAIIKRVNTYMENYIKLRYKAEVMGRTLSADHNPIWCLIIQYPFVRFFHNASESGSLCQMFNLCFLNLSIRGTNPFVGDPGVESLSLKARILVRDTPNLACLKCLLPLPVSIHTSVNVTGVPSVDALVQMKISHMVLRQCFPLEMSSRVSAAHGTPPPHTNRKSKGKKYTLDDFPTNSAIIHG